MYGFECYRFIIDYDIPIDGLCLVSFGCAIVGGKIRRRELSTVG